MRRPFVAGNWKMHGTRQSAVQLADGVASAGIGGEVDVAVCPPFVLLECTGAILGDSGIALGAQDVCEVSGEGAYTGEVSAAMLADAGCSLVIVGHSERRARYGDTDALVADKVAAAQAAGLTPILCIGETEEERTSGDTESVLATQLDAVLSGCGIEAFARMVLAYEPVWAIGTGKTATPEQVAQTHAFIRAHIAREDATIAGDLRVVYGGSVKPSNAAELFACDDVDGGLIGGASLHADKFVAICRAACAGN